MKRRYNTDLFRHKIEEINKHMPHAFIGVDVIVGARGETPECFEEAYQFIQSLSISQLHVFPYSERPGTLALKIDEIVSPQEKQKRSHALLNVSDEKLLAFYQAQKDTIHEVLFEQPKPGHPMHGFTENYIRVELPYTKELVNQTHKVRLTEMIPGDVPAYKVEFL